MTPEERAAAVVEPWQLDELPLDSSAPAQMEAEVAAAIRVAVAEEREACAKLAESWDDWQDGPLEGRHDVARAIRSRP